MSSIDSIIPHRIFLTKAGSAIYRRNIMLVCCCQNGVVVPNNVLFENPHAFLRSTDIGIWRRPPPKAAKPSPSATWPSIFPASTALLRAARRGAGMRSVAKAERKKEAQQSAPVAPRNLHQCNGETAYKPESNNSEAGAAGIGAKSSHLRLPERGVAARVLRVALRLCRGVLRRMRATTPAKPL